MQLSEQDIILLEDYWKGDLQGPDRVLLEKRLATDEAFQQAAQEWQYIVSVGFLPTEKESEKRESMRRQLESIERTEPYQEEKKPLASKIRILYTLVGIAATICLIVLINYIIPDAHRSGNIQIEHLAMDHSTYSLGGESPGEKAYREQQYTRAYELLTQEISAPSDSLNLLYAGISALHIGLAREAVPMLQYIVSAKDWRDYHWPARWYLALAYAQSGNREAAVELMQLIIADGPNNPYYEQAKALQISLNR